MAQERRVPPHRRLRALARRYGLVGHRAVAAAACALVAAIAVATATRIMGTSGMEIARSDAPVEELCEALLEGRPDRERTEEMTPAPAGPSRGLVQSARRYTPTQLASCLRACATCERELKGGGNDEEAAFVKLVLSIGDPSSRG